MPSGSSQAKKPIERKEKSKKVVRLEKREEITPIDSVSIDCDELVFALDIGTRSVVGIAGIQEGDKFKIFATEIIEHKNRAMMDGQIHDIDQVAFVVNEVKGKLESRLGIHLKRVAIAAAGRVLRTSRIKVDRDVEHGREIDHELVNSLEIEGIQRAQMALDEDLAGGDRTQFYCVGYSVINYYLNDYIISRLEGHKGKNIAADILATFLPHMVVDSLYTVMNRVGLEVSSLTLEPIAAINVTIPHDLRLLNLALVDVGAGTSDIALTRDGSIIAYAMVPSAGDEITERISQNYLVDFNTAEKIKLSLGSAGETVNFSDILNIKHKVNISEVTEVIKPAVELLADTISDKIMEFNGKAPNAVFLIGGGSQINGLAGMIAKRLSLSGDRVVVRSRDVIKDVKFTDKKLSGPESITPYGIAVTAQLQKGRDFLNVTVNGRKVKMFNSKKLSVADALILLGYNPGQLIGRTGKSISFTLNGERKLIRGEYGKAAEISVNSTPASLETWIKYNDEITIVPAQDGRDACIILSNLLEANGVDDTYDVLVNGKIQNKDYVVKDSDTINYSIRESISVNNEKPAEESDRDGEILEVLAAEIEPEVNYKEFQAEIVKTDVNNQRSVVLSVNGEKIIIKDGKSQHIFVDVFNYIHFDLTRPQGAIVLKLNGQQAAFTDNIKNGDIIEIYWQK